MAVLRAANPALDASEAARAIFEPQLAAIGLSLSDIEAQGIDELHRSLEAVNSAIQNPDSFGKCRFRFSTSGSVVISTQDNSSVEVGVLPILLERRRQIEARLKLLQVNEEVTALEDRLDETEGDPTAQAALEVELQSKRHVKTELEEKSKLHDAQQRKIEVEIQAEKTRMRQSWLERESVASLIGAILLLLIAATLVTAMFTGTVVSDILGNAFLLVLGYFFGQSTSKKG